MPHRRDVNTPELTGSLSMEADTVINDRDHKQMPRIHRFQNKHTFTS